MKSVEKTILDACCGGRTFWFNKSHPDALYMDIRKADPGVCSHRPNFSVQPDEIGDFKNLRFKDGQFKMVVFDPPHLHSLGKSSWMAKKYGRLEKATWKDVLLSGFNECWRVLDTFGTLVFKWNEEDIPLHEVLKLFPVQPLIGHTTGNRMKTKWVIFMKMPLGNEKK